MNAGIIPPWLRHILSNKMGVTGIVIITFFSLVAIFAPYLTPNDPNTNFASGPWALPEWARVFPQYSGLPTNSELLNPAIGAWIIQNAPNVKVKVSDANIQPQLLSSSRYPASATDFGALFVNATLPGTLVPTPITILTMNQTFRYNLEAPYDFAFGLYTRPALFQNLTDYYFQIILINPQGDAIQLTSYALMSSSPIENINYQNGFASGRWNSISLSTRLPDVNTAAIGPSGGSHVNTGLQYLGKTGNYTLEIQLVAVTSTNLGNLSVGISYPYIFVYGRAYGLMGTDNFGRDLWSQFVFGSRISLEVGLLASVITVVIGCFLGLIAGIFTGIVDETLMRLADVILTIPFLPLAIVVIFVLTQNAFIARSLYFWLIILFVLISWPGLARIVRSQTLSLKERGFVESSRALGAGRLYLVRKHLLPNVMGLVYAELALSVPGFILTEAALDFLFPGASIIPTWGRTLSNAYEQAASAAYYNFGWWWFIFPGISIVILSLSFVLLGFALDEVFNPKLRER